MQTEEIRKRFLNFFQKRNHIILPSASLVPENDPSVLFNTAGMQQLVPYLLGKKHPLGRRLVNFQPCVRTVDIEEVGDITHLTLFEMMGNWSLGDYFKTEAIKWSYELLTNKEEGFGLDPARIYITVFAGNDKVAADEEAVNIWKSLGMPENRIYYLESNWWTPGDNGPCGPCSEMFYDLTEDGLGDLDKEEFLQADEDQKLVEIWNDVFMEYEQRKGEVVGRLKSKNIDTGAGLERLAMVLQNKKDVFAIDIFTDFFSTLPPEIRDLSESKILADHLRTIIFLIAENISPANTDQGYVLRRLLRRSIRIASSLQIESDILRTLLNVLIQKMGRYYSHLEQATEEIINIFKQEEEKFSHALSKGLMELEKGLIANQLPAEIAFKLITTYGFPLELVLEEAKVRNIFLDKEKLNSLLLEHKKISKLGSDRKFKSGLADSDTMTIKYHTATHLLHQALYEVLDSSALQKGSNITKDRLRFDFAWDRKLTSEEKEEIEKRVNQKIAEDLSINLVELPLEEARKKGARALFNAKYGERVSVYYIGDNIDTAYSKEFCAGPHVSSTGELGVFKIKKEEAVGAGVRRIKAILE